MTPRGPRPDFSRRDGREREATQPRAFCHVVLVGGETRLCYGFGDQPTHPGTEWTSYEVPLSPAGWTNFDTGEQVTEETFEALLSDLDALWIRGEYRSGADTGGLDTVEMSG